MFSDAPPSYDQVTKGIVHVHPNEKYCPTCATPVCPTVRFCSTCGSETSPSSTAPPEHTVVTVQPARVMDHSSVKIDNRLIYDFEKLSCCYGQISGLNEAVKNNIPGELYEKGFTSDQWYEWMSELDEIQKLPPPICCCLIQFCFPGGPVQAMLCAMFCPVSGNHCLTWLHEALRKWMEKVNRTLNTHGMHAKLTTYKPFSRAPHSKHYNERVVYKDHNYEMSFLEIALTPNASAKLQQESWDHGVNDGCTSGIGRCL